MAEAYKGLVIRIGADTAKLEKALRSSDRAIKETQKQLRTLERAAKIDPANMRVMNERLDQMGSKAATVTRRFLTIYDATKQLRSSGIEKLANQTKDAAFQAENARERYAEICDQIKRYKNQLAGLAGYNVAKNDPFKGAQGYQASLAVMKQIGATTDQIAKYSNLVAEYWARLSEKDIAEKVEQFKQLKVQLAANGAEVRSLYTEMARIAAENPAATQTAKWRRCAEEIGRAGEAAKSAEARMHQLDEAMRLDPTIVSIAAQKMEAMQERITANVAQMKLLNQQMDKLRDRGADKTASDMKNLGMKVEKVKARVAELNAEMDTLKADKAFDAQSADAKRLNAQLERATSLLNKMSEAAVYKNLNTQLSALTAQTTKLTSELDGASNMSNRMRGTIQQLGWSMYSTVTPIFSLFASEVVSSSEEIDTAFRNMVKTVQGTDEQFEQLKQHALDYSRTHFTSADQILEIEAMGGQLGIATDKLEAFAQTVSNVDIATDLDADTAAQQLGQLQGMLNDMTQDDFAKYGDALVRLGNNNATLESRIQDVMLRIASMGTITGFSTPQLLAWSTAVASTGQGCEAAGTAISKTMSDIENAVGAGGDSLNAFASVAGMSASEFANSWNTDPSGTMYAFIQGLKQIEENGGSADATLGQLGINSVRQKQSILGLMQTIDGLNDSLTMSEDAWNGVSDEWGASGDAAREAERKAEGFSGAIQMLRNNFQVFGAEVGYSLIPIIQALTQAVAVMTKAYSDSPEAVKQLVNILVAVAVAAGPAIVAASSLKNAWAELSLALKAKTAWKAAKAGAEAVNKVLKTLVTQTVASTAANGANTASTLVMSTAQKVAAASTKLLGVAMKALPLVLIATLVVEAASAFAEYNKRAQIAKQATDGMRDSMSAFDSAAASDMTDALGTVTSSVEEAMQSQADLAKSIADTQAELGGKFAKLDTFTDSIERLGGKSNLTAAEQTELSRAISGVNSICGTSYKIVDKQNGKLNESTAAILKNTEAWKKNAKAQAAQQAYSDILAETMKLEYQLELVNGEIEKMEDSGTGAGFTGVAVKSRKEAEELEAAIAANYEAMDHYSDIADEAADATDDVANAQSGLASALGMTDEEYEALATSVDGLLEQYPTLNETLANSGASVEDFAAYLTDAGIEVTDLGTKIDSYADKATDAFNRIESESDLSLDQMLENMQHNADVTASWSDNIQALYAKAGYGSAREFVEHLASLGPGYAKQVEDLLNSSDTYLQQFADAWASGSQAAVNAALAEMGILPDEVAGFANQAAANVGQAAVSAKPTTTEEWASFANDTVSQVTSRLASIGRAAVGASNDYAEGISAEKDKVGENATAMANESTKMNANSASYYMWGWEAGANFAAGMQKATYLVRNASSLIANAVASALKHSVPKEGPLHNHGKGEAEWGKHIVQNLISGIDSEEAALRAKVEMIPNAVKDAIDRAQEYTAGGVSLQASVASGFAARSAERAASSAVANTYVIESMTIQVKEVTDIDPVKIVTEFAQRANRANGR